ncbi:hypothetical protein [Pseudonocardia phyllosphaerae]|uniref:hypothetical protein n=1 Tax=Pseudonocardia phyllosphaerae TaxID=3390502 RepID=UPI00397AB9A4
MVGFVFTWIVFLVVLGLFGARAWVVETNRGRLTSGGSTQRSLTTGLVGAIAVLLVLMVFNGGTTLADLLLNGEQSASQQQIQQGQDPDAS